MYSTEDVINLFKDTSMVDAFERRSRAYERLDRKHFDEVDDYIARTGGTTKKAFEQAVTALKIDERTAAYFKDTTRVSLVGFGYADSNDVGLILPVRYHQRGYVLPQVLIENCEGCLSQIGRVTTSSFLGLVLLEAERNGVSAVKNILKGLEDLPRSLLDARVDFRANYMYKKGGLNGYRPTVETEDHEDNGEEYHTLRLVNRSQLQQDNSLRDLDGKTLVNLLHYAKGEEVVTMRELNSLGYSAELVYELRNKGYLRPLHTNILIFEVGEKGVTVLDRCDKQTKCA